LEILVIASKGNVAMNVYLLKKTSNKKLGVWPFGAIRALALTTCLAIASSHAIAKDEGAKVIGTLDQNRIVMVDGKEVAQAADKVAPGDLLQYRVRYSNSGSTVANNLVVTLPIPKGLEFAATTDVPKAALASLDGERFEAMPIRRSMRQADGKEILRDVPLSQYRALRWQVEQLAAGKTVTFTARARVENNVTAAATISNK
jgi:uncharacterized repeat protein (TIGR01451 family)